MDSWTVPSPYIKLHIWVSNEKQIQKKKKKSSENKDNDEEKRIKL